jgi:hypothetical protein
VSVKIEEFVAHLGWEVDASELENFNSQLKDTVAFFAKIAAAIAGATTALAAFTVATNKQTSIQTQLAEAYDISAESAENWGFLLGAIGLETENVIRAAKDLNVRLGQAFAGIGDAKTMKDAVKSLGLEFQKLKNLKPEEQFKTILQAAKDLDNSQVALAASQQLLGRQGTMLTGFLRDQEGTIEELLEAQGKFNLLTQENREQAVAFTALWDNTTAVLGSAKASFAAFLGEALAPLLKEFLDWVKLNRELIKIKIAEWAERIGRFMEIVFRTMKWGMLVLDEIVSVFGGFKNVLAALGGVIAGLALSKLVMLFMKLGPLVLSAVAAVKKLTVASALLGAKWMIAAGAVALAGLAINSLIRFFQGKDSLVGEIGGHIADQMELGILSVGKFFGLTEEQSKLWKEELDLKFTRLLWDIEKTFKGAWEAVSGWFNAMLSLDWAEVGELWGDAWRSIVKGLGKIWKGFVDWFKTNVIDAITIGVRIAFQTATTMLKKIPLVGRLFDEPKGALGESIGQGAKTSAVNIAAGVAVPATVPQLPSLGVLRTINQTRELLNTVNNVSKTSSPTVNLTQNITQQPGESGEALGRRIQSGVKEEFATAIRDNDSGVEY